MHIKNPAKTASIKRHRLYVAVPLFTLCAALSFGSMALHGDILAGTDDASTVVEGEGVFSRSGSTVLLASGDIVVAARGIARVQAGAFEARGWNGAYALAVQDESLDVAALTTPVVVRTAKDFWIVPAGMQMRVADSSPVFAEDTAGWIAARQPVSLPAHYLQERLPEAGRLLESAPFSAAAHSTLSRMQVPVLQLPASRLRVQEERRDEGLEALHQALLQGDVPATREALRADTAQAALADTDTLSLLPELLTLAHATGQAPLLLPYFQQSAENLPLALLHPALREHAWVLPWPDVPSDMRIALLLGLLTADHEEDAVAALAIERWGGHWNDLLMQTDLPMLLADSVLPSVQHEILSLERMGYPERARRYAAAVVGAFYPRMEEFSPEAKTILERLGAFAAGSTIVTAPVDLPEPEATAEASSASSVAAPDAAQAAALEQTVRALLTNAGAMFTGKTSVRAVTTEHVAVEGVVIGTNAGDQLIGFTYDVAADQVVNIEKEGSILPYSLPLQKYLEWVREGK